MNSLSYLSRQFDVLASSSAPNTPPSTPTDEKWKESGSLSSSSSYPTLPVKRIRTWAFARTFFPLVDSAGRPIDSPQTHQRRRSGSSPGGSALVHPHLQKAGSSSRVPQSGVEPDTRADEAVVKSPRREQPVALNHQVSSQEPRTIWSGQFLAIRVFVMFARWCSTLWYGLTRPLRLGIGSLKGKEPERIRPRGFARTINSTAEDEKAGSFLQAESSYVRRRVSSLMKYVLQPQRRPLTPTTSQRTVTPPPTVNLIPPDSTSVADVKNPYHASLSPSSSSTSKLSLPNLSSPPRPRPASNTQNSSRATSPGTKRTPLHQRKTLVLDLDETLIHSTTRPIYPYKNRTGYFNLSSLIGFGQNKRAGHMVEVVMNGRSTLYHVYKRPFADYFLRKVSAWYTLVIFTASVKEYADPVIDWLDAGRGMFGSRFFREHCTQLPNGSYSKDLTILNEDLSRICLVDNSPISYSINKANGIPIEGWTHDPYDEALLDLLPVLDSLRFTNDVRHVLGLRGF